MFSEIHVGFGLVSLWLYFYHVSRLAHVLFIVSTESLKKEGFIFKKKKMHRQCVAIVLLSDLGAEEILSNTSRSTAYLHNEWTTVDKACVEVSNSPPAPALDSKK